MTLRKASVYFSSRVEHGVSTHMYVASGSRQRMIRLMEEDSRFGMSPSITHGDLAPDRMSSTKLKRVSVEQRMNGLMPSWKDCCLDCGLAHFATILINNVVKSFFYLLWFYIFWWVIVSDNQTKIIEVNRKDGLTCYGKHSFSTQPVYETELEPPTPPIVRQQLLPPDICNYPQLVLIFHFLWRISVRLFFLDFG